MKPVDRNDVKGLETYTGDIALRMSWSHSFMLFLQRKNWWWPGLLENVQELNGKPVTEEDQRRWAGALGIYNMEEFKDQFLWFDAGDQFTGTVENIETTGKLMVDFYNALKRF